MNLMYVFELKVIVIYILHMIFFSKHLVIYMLQVILSIYIR